MLEKNFVKIKLPLIIYMFLLLFAPPILKDINILLILFLFSFFVIIMKYRKELKEIIKSKHIKKILGLLFVYYIYYFGVIVINGIITNDWHFYNYLISTYSMVLVFPIITVCATHIVLYIRKNNISFNELIKLIIISGLIQSFFTLLAFLFPAVKEVLVKIMYNNTGEQLYLNKYHIERRCFGFANNLLDSFGFGTGIIAVLPLFYSINNSKKWLISVPFLLMVPLVNSRTGLLIFAIGFVFWIIYIIKNRMFGKYRNIFILAALLAFTFLILVNMLSPKTMRWIINDFSSFFTDKKGTADILFGADFWRLPSIVKCIFGAGLIVAGHGGLKGILGFTSDVGYINEIWKTGIIGVILLLFTFYLLVRFSNKKLSKEYRIFMAFLFFASLVANIKFIVFSYSPGMVIISIIAIFALISKQDDESSLEVSEELVSIIVPVYNVENYLERCLNSIVAQTYKNMEIILVNDGSKDNSKEICKKFQKSDNRIKYIEQENQGLSAARNNGLNASKGKYVIFIDSDDFVNINFVKELYMALINTNSDIAICNYKKVFDSTVDMYKKDNGLIQSFTGKNKFYNLYNDKSTITTVAWNKIYKREIFKNTKYPVGKVHEDEFVIYDVLNNAKKITYTSCEYYYYFQRENSITAKYNKKRLDILEAFDNRLKVFSNTNEKMLYSYTLYNYFYQLVYQYNMMNKYFENEGKIRGDIYNKIQEMKKEFFVNVYINPLKKVKVFLKMWNIKG